MLRGVRIPTNRPPSWRTHSITMRVGPGGEHTYSIRIVRPGRPVPSGRIPAREGVVRLGDPFHLVPAARPRTSIKVSRSWRKCERCRWPWVPVLKWPRETVLRHLWCFSTPNESPVRAVRSSTPLASTISHAAFLCPRILNRTLGW